MIGSVIANFSNNADMVRRAIDCIQQRPEFEMGALVDGRKLPITIEAHSERELEDATDWLRSVQGVDHVDVVFVYFGDDTNDSPGPSSPRSSSPVSGGVKQ